MAGGAIFPGVHHLAEFSVEESNGNYKVAFVSDDGTSLSIEAKETNKWNEESVFENIDCVSEFFKNGSVGYSPSKNQFEGLELKAYNWKVSLLDATNVQSSFFENEKVFPKGSVRFDNALLMRGIEHEWIGLNKLEKAAN